MLNELKKMGFAEESANVRGGFTDRYFVLRTMKAARAYYVKILDSEAKVVVEVITANAALTVYFSVKSAESLRQTLSRADYALDILERSNHSP